MRPLPPRRSVPLVAIALVALAAACGRSDGRDQAQAAERRGDAMAAAPGFDPTTKTIRLGVLAPLTGPVALTGEYVTNGNRVFFDALNVRGGVGGRYRVELVVKDHMFDNPTTVQKYQQLRDDVALFQIFGTPQTAAVRAQLATDGVVAAPFSIDSEWMADVNLLPVPASVQVQFLNAADWYLNRGGGKGKAICAMAVDNPLGEAGVEAVKAASAAFGFPVEATVRFKSSDQEFASQLAQLKSAGCQAVFLVGLPAHTGPILGGGAKIGFNPKWIGSVSAWTPKLAESPQLLPILRESLLVSYEGPEWGDESVPGMHRMLADRAEYHPGQPPDIYFVYGYAQAMAMAALLEKAVEFGDLSRAGLLEAMRRLGTVSFDGLMGDYTYGEPAARRPSRSSGVFRVDPDVPGGLKAVETGITSEAARQFSFERYLKE